MKYLIFLFIILKVEASIWVVHDDKGRHGLFSCFTNIIGLLDHYELGGCDGLIVDYKDKGLYYDKKKGRNWWNYYFKPIHLIRNPYVPYEVISSSMHVNFAYRATDSISSERAFELIQKYIHLKPALSIQINQFVKRNFRNHYVIGVHYRGTDKDSEAKRVDYEEVYQAICNARAQVNKTNVVIFLATDEQKMVRFLRSKFGKKLICLNSIRATNRNPIHTDKKNGYRKGKEAVMDCILLSKCDYLIRTSSNLSLCSTFFNPNIPTLLLNPNNHDLLRK